MTLWLCSKFSIAFPYLPHYPSDRDVQSPTTQDFHSKSAITAHNNPAAELPPAAMRMSVRTQGAAPPVYMMLIALVPVGTASFISASRWFDHRHGGWDILAGSLLGVFFAWVGFWMYNTPITRGAGWSWGSRSRHHAFFKGVGFPSYNGEDNWTSMRRAHLIAPERQPDLETGQFLDDNGHPLVVFPEGAGPASSAYDRRAHD